MIAYGGRDTAWFIAPERRRGEVMLAAVAGQIVDDDLNDLVGQAQLAWHECWTWSSSTTPADPKRVEKQISAAEKGMSAARKAIDRTNVLIREAS